MMENKKVISRSLIVLFLSLSIVYSLVYQKKEDLFKTTIESWDELINQTQTGISYDDIQSQTSILGELDLPTEDVSGEWIHLWNEDEIDLSNADLTNDSDFITLDMNKYSDSVSLTTNIKTLPGTTEYFGTLDIVNMLWKKPEFTLQDSKWNFFVYYWNHLDFIQTIQTLGGNVYEMITESEILQNQLFWDRVSYINLSTFKDVWVIMVVEIDGNVWLIQVPADKYHYSKDYLKSLFIQ